MIEGTPPDVRPKVHFIDELEQIEALVSPVRGLLLSTLCSSGPCSVGELARLVGRKPRALYYHLDALVACGLVKEVGSRPTRRRQETLYDAVADTVMVDDFNDLRLGDACGCLMLLEVVDQDYPAAWCIEDFGARDYPVESAVGI